MSGVHAHTSLHHRHRGSGVEPNLLHDPAWFLDRLDLRRGLGVFTRTSRATLAKTVFLDPRWDRAGAEQRVAPLAQIRDFQAPGPPPAIIWHSAFCCSTLIADCLDAQGVSLALKEPMALVDLDLARRQGVAGADDRLAAAALALLGRGFTSGERVVIKPSNGANALMAAAAGAGGPMLMLYSSCRDFILSVVGGGPEIAGGEVRRKFVRDLLADRVLAGRAGPRWRPPDLCQMTDLQAAALLWHLQMAEFRAAAQALGPRRARSLDCEAFLAAPAQTLERLDRFFGLGLGQARIDAIVQGPKLSRYAKQPTESFDVAVRRKGLSEVEATLGPWLEALVAWSYQVSPETPRGDPVGAPLTVP